MYGIGWNNRRLPALFALVPFLLLAGCFGEDDGSSADEQVEAPTAAESPDKSQPALMGLSSTDGEPFVAMPYLTEPLTLPYYANNFDSEEQRASWTPGANWRFRVADADDWWLEFRKKGKGLGTQVHSKSALTEGFSIPSDARAPTLYFDHKLGLQKKNHCVLVEAGEAGSGQWSILSKLCVADNTAEYRRIGVDLTNYTGKTVLVRFRVLEPLPLADKPASTKGADAAPLADRGTSGDSGDIRSDRERQKQNTPKAPAASKGRARGAPAVSTGPADAADRADISSANAQQTEETQHGKAPVNETFWIIDNVRVTEKDSDGDGIADEFEQRVGTDPKDPGSTPVDDDNDFIPDVLNQLAGQWRGQCRSVGGGEYVLPLITFTPRHVAWRFESHADENCTHPWLTVEDRYDFRFQDIETITDAGAYLKLALAQTILFPNTTGPAESLDRLCPERTITFGEGTLMNGAVCGPALKYPDVGVQHSRRLVLNKVGLFIAPPNDGASVYTDPLLDSYPATFVRAE